MNKEALIAEVEALIETLDKREDATRFEDTKANWRCMKAGVKESLEIITKNLDGMVIVPEVPTRKMLYSGAEDTNLAEFCTSSRQSRHHEIANQVYKAMITAYKGEG